MQREVREICPLLLPSSISKFCYQGYVSSGGSDYRISITTPPSGQLRDARLECDWKLRIILRGCEEVIQKRLEQSGDVASFLVELKSILDRVQLVRPRFDVPLPPTFYSQLISDVDHLGWERIAHVDTSLTNLSVRVEDGKGRDHQLHVHLSTQVGLVDVRCSQPVCSPPLPQHPVVPPVCSADTPMTFEPQWSAKSTLVDLVNQFRQWLLQFDTFWEEMEEVDARTWLLEPENPSRACTHRRIVIEANVSLQLMVDPLRPRAIPGCAFLGPDQVVGPMKETLHSKREQWNHHGSLLNNLEEVLGITFPSPSSTRREEFSVECGICYAYRLNVGGALPEIVCDNSHCGQPFHHPCLLEWLRGLPTSRMSFNTIFGECPYCNQPISIHQSIAL